MRQVRTSVCKIPSNLVKISLSVGEDVFISLFVSQFAMFVVT